MWQLLLGLFIFQTLLSIIQIFGLLLIHYVLQTGDDLIDGNHYASHEIEARIEGLDAHWETLNDK